MSTPSYMMEAEFEMEGYMYEDYNDNDNDDEAYYSIYGESKCTVCMGGSYIKKLYLNKEDYEEVTNNDF